MFIPLFAWKRVAGHFMVKQMHVSSKQIFIHGDDSAAADDDREGHFSCGGLDNFTNASDFHSERMFS